MRRKFFAADEVRVKREPQLGTVLILRYDTEIMPGSRAGYYILAVPADHPKDAYQTHELELVKGGEHGKSTH